MGDDQRVILRNVLEQLNAIKLKTEDFSKIPPENQAEFDFTMKSLPKTIDFFSKYINTKLVNFDSITHITTQFESIRKSLEAIANTTIHSPNFQQEVLRHSNTVISSYKSVFGNTRDLLPYLVINGSLIEDLTDSKSVQTQEAKAKIDETLSQIAKDQEAVRDLKIETESIVDSVKKTAQKAGVTDQAVTFKKQADDYQKRSWWWLAAATLLIGGVILFIFCDPLESIFKTNAKDVETLTLTQDQLLIKYLSSKLIILSLWFYAIIHCLRNYTAYLHNSVVNRHRQNALQTFEVFVKGSSDDQTKEAILLEATKSIFSPQATGYLKNEPDAQPSNTFIELIKSIKTNT